MVRRHTYSLSLGSVKYHAVNIFEVAAYVSKAKLSAATLKGTTTGHFSGLF